MKKALARWIPWAKYLIAGGLLIALFASGQIDFDVLGRALDRWPWLLAGLLSVTGIFGFGITRWWLLLRSQGISITPWETVRVAFIGYFFNTVMPGSVGGDLVKAYYVARDRMGQRIEAVSTIVLDRLIGLFALISIAAMAAVAFPSVGFGPPAFRTASIFVLVMLAAAMVVVLLILTIDLRRISFFNRKDPGRILGGIRRIYDAVWLYRKKKKVLVLALLLSFGAHSFGVILNIALAKSLGEADLTLPQYLYVIPLALTINGIPVTPGGWGVGEIGYHLLFETATGSADNIGAELALLMHLAYTFWNLLGVFFYVGHRRAVEEARLLAEEEGGS